MHDELLKRVLGSSLDDAVKVSLTKILMSHDESLAENIRLKCILAGVIFSAGANWEYRIKPEHSKEVERILLETGKVPEISIQELNGGISIKASFRK